MTRLPSLALAGLLLGTVLAAVPGRAAAAGPWPAPVLPDSAVAAAQAAAHQAEAADRARAPRRVRLGGVRVDLRPGTEQVVTVNHRGGHGARVSFWVRTGDRWRRTMTAVDGRIGYGGLVPRKERRQGTGATPIGTFGLPFAFGEHRRRAAWDLRYRKIRAGDYWVQDNGSPHYNRYRNKRQGGFRWWLPPGHENSSERLPDFRGQYEWAIVMDFNWNQVRHRGSGIFLHVNGDGATAGCVSAPRWFVKRLMRRLDPARTPVVAVGR